MHSFPLAMYGKMKADEAAQERGPNNEPKFGEDARFNDYEQMLINQSAGT